MTTLKQRELAQQPYGWGPEVPEVMQRIYAARGVFHPTGIEQRLAEMLPPSLLGGIDKAAELITRAIVNDERIMVAGDYDCDGATGSATAVRGLRLLGAKYVDFIVPNRFAHGYGLSPGLIDAMVPYDPQLVVTVDSGVSSVEGVQHAKSKGMKVVITDHHLQGDVLPDADAIVNPNLRGDPFPSKGLAGVGVMLYVLLATRRYMANLGIWPKGEEPDLLPLLDLVAIGTVADLVPLDKNNRILVEAGLRRIRQGKTTAGVTALIASAKRDQSTLVASDIAFSIAPRLNAAGRLEDMRLGVLTMLCENPVQAETYVKALEAINDERKEIQASMVTEAEQMVLNAKGNDAVGVVVFDPKWHHGVVGLVASKLKESLYRPVIAMAPEGEEARGSCRSIPGFHLRDALAVVDANNPGLIKKFGGHAMAAGLTIMAKDIDRLAAEFDKVARQQLSEEQLSAVVYTDGELPPGYINLAFAKYVRECGPWGQAFPEPAFENTFFVQDVRILGDKHLRLDLIDPRDGTYVQGIFFNGYKGGDTPEYVRLAYELSINVFNGRESLQLMVRYMEPVQ